MHEGIRRLCTLHSRAMRLCRLPMNNVSDSGCHPATARVAAYCSCSCESLVAVALLVRLLGSAPQGELAGAARPLQHRLILLACNSQHADCPARSESCGTHAIIEIAIMLP